MANKMLRRIETDQIVYGRDLNRFLDVILGNSPGRISLLDDGGDELNTRTGAVISSNNYSFKARSAAGRHGLYQHSAGVLKVLDIQDSGITTDVPIVANGNVTLGDAAGDTLIVNATATFKNAVTIGETSGDILTVESITTFKAAVSFLHAVTIGDAVGDTLTVESTTAFNGPATFNGNVTLGNAAGDTITVTGTMTVTPLATFSNGLTVSAGVVTLPVGSAAAPSLAVGEAVTGLFRQAANVLGVTVNGTERMRLSATDLKTIGTTITLNNNTGYRAIESDGTTIRNLMKIDGSNVVQMIGATGGWVLDSSAIQLKYAGTRRIEIDSTGVGFFAVTPVARQSIGAAATDAATTQTLANNIRTALVNLGLCQT